MAWFMGLGACASNPAPVFEAPSAPEPVFAPEPVATDAQVCQSRSECTLKVSRSLLFVFAYAEAGAPLLERYEPRRLRTPEPADGPWPALDIELAEAEGGAFIMRSECRVGCRVGPSEVLRAYRLYLDGGACHWHHGRCEALSKTP